MGDFDKYTDFNENAGIRAVKIGAKKPVLETEFNEMQEIVRKSLSKFISNHIGDGIYDLGTMNYAEGVFTISNEKALVSGELINISSLSLDVAEGESIYIDVYDKEVSYLNTLKTEGNEQELSEEVNYFIDSRVSQETARRIVLAFTLSKTNIESEHRYLLLGTITGGVFIPSVINVNSSVILGRITELEDEVAGKIYAYNNIGGAL